MAESAVAEQVLEKMETVEVSKDLLQSIIDKTQAQPAAFTLVPKDLVEATKYAELISKSKLCPKDYQGKVEDIVVATMYGMELGLKPLQALACIAVINGRAAIWGDGALAVVLASGQVEDFKELCGSDALSAGAGFCKIKRKGRASWIEVRFTVEDAKAARLWTKEGPWTQYPGRMLQMRARGFALRDGFADVLKGLVFVEETADYQEGGLGEHTRAVAEETLKRPVRTVDAPGASTVKPAEPSPSDRPATGSTPAPAPAAPPAGEIPTGTWEGQLEKVETFDYPKTDRKTKKPTGEKGYGFRLIGGGKTFVTFSTTERDIAQQAIGAAVPVRIRWEHKPGKQTPNVVDKGIEQVIPGPAPELNDLPDEPGMNG